MDLKPLTPAQHAHLLGLQQAVDAALRERDGFLRYLAAEHAVDPAQWSLDLATGHWEPVTRQKETPTG